MPRETSQKIIETIISVKGDKASLSVLNAFEKKVEGLILKLQSVGAKVGTPVFMGKEFTPTPGAEGRGKFVSKFGLPFQAGGQQFFQEIDVTKKTGDQYSVTAGKLNELGKTTDEHRKSVGLLEADYAKLAIRAISVIPIWMALRTVYIGLFRLIGEGIQSFKELDTALADIRITGNYTEKDLKALKETIMGLSIAYGLATDKVTKATVLFAQQGLTANQTIAMLRASMVGAVVLGDEIENVAENLTAAIRAYNFDVSESISIVDKWMAIHKNFAVTAKDLADATKTAGATAAAFGIDYEIFLGHITAIIETTRRSGTQAANALQMIYTRLFTTGREAIQEIAKVPIFAGGGGKGVFETTHVYRQAKDVLEDLAISWKNLTEAQKIQLATQVASRRQAAPFIALMEQYPRAIEAQIAAYTSAGDALKSFAIRQDTILIKAQQMRSAWSNLIITASNTDVWKGLIDSFGKIALGLTALINRTTSLNYIITSLTEKALSLKEVELSEAKALTELISLREKYNLKLTEVPETAKADIQKYIDLIDKAIGERTVNKDQIALLELQVAKGRIALENPELNKRRIAIEQELQKLKDFIAKSTMIPAVRIAQEKAPTRIRELEFEQKKVVEQIEKEAKQRILSNKALKEKEDLEEKLQRHYEERDRVAKEEQIRVDHESNLLKIRGKTEEEILRFKIAQYETNEKLITSEDARLERLRLQYQLEEQILQTRQKYSDVLKESLETGFENLLASKGGFFTGINEAFIKSYRQTVAEGLSKMVMSTGIGDIFGQSFVNLKNIFGLASNKIESSFDVGGKIAYDWIVRGFRDAQFGVGASTATFGGTIATTGGTTLPGFGQGGWFNQPFGRSPVANRQVATVMGKPVFGRDVRGGGVTRGQAAGIGVQGALTGYSAYQSSRAGGIPTGQAVAGGLMTGLGSTLLTIAALNAWNPMGWVIAGATLLAGVLTGTLGGRKARQTSVDVKTTENRISSRIDVTNKNLEIINRNLIALKNSVETYVLPSSAYFAEKRNVEDQFALFSRMGFNG